MQKAITFVNHDLHLGNPFDYSWLPSWPSWAWTGTARECENHGLHTAKVSSDPTKGSGEADHPTAPSVFLLALFKGGNYKAFSTEKPPDQHKFSQKTTVSQSYWLFYYILNFKWIWIHPTALSPQPVTLPQAAHFPLKMGNSPTKASNWGGSCHYPAVPGRNLNNSCLPQTTAAASTLTASIWITEAMTAESEWLPKSSSCGVQSTFTVPFLLWEALWSLVYVQWRPPAAALPCAHVQSQSAVLLVTSAHLDAR